MALGHRYSFRLNGTGPNPLPDPYLRLHSRAAGNPVLAYNDDGGPGLNSLISNFRAPYTGTYWLDAGAFNNASTGRYTLIA
jgi:serralysin